MLRFNILIFNFQLWEPQPELQTYFTIDVVIFIKEGRDDNMQASQDESMGWWILWDDSQTQTLSDPHLERERERERKIKTNMRVYVTLMA